MRRRLMFLAPFALAALAAPASAQISARVHIDIPIGIGHPVVVRPPFSGAHLVAIYDYDRGRFGDWDRDGRRWQTVTVYLFGGRYYDRPVRGARAVVVYRDRGRYFFPPRDARWDRDHGRDHDWARRDDRDRDDRGRARGDDGDRSRSRPHG